MPNSFFYDYQKLNTTHLFSAENITTKKGTQYERQYQVLKVNMNEALIQHALKIAQIKSQYTMNANQAEEARTPEQKLLSAFRGILAETAVHILLEKYLNTTKTAIKRFDLERESFEYSSDEYDLQLIYNHHSYEMESRSSENYKQDLAKGLERLDILGTYTNGTKIKEEPAEFYIRPLYQYTNFTGFQERNINKYIHMLRQEEIILYLTSGTDRETMAKYGRLKPMGQNNTLYRCLWLHHYKTKDMKQFLIQLRGTFK